MSHEEANNKDEGIAINVNCYSQALEMSDMNKVGINKDRLINHEDQTVSRHIGAKKIMIKDKDRKGINFKGSINPGLADKDLTIKKVGSSRDLRMDE